jgi:hypothetical protein
MVKAAVDVSPIVNAYIDKLKHDLDVDRVLLADVHTGGIDGEPTEIWFIVVASAFEKMAWLKRSEVLGLAGLDVSPLIMAWPYTPDEFSGHFRGDRYDGWLAQTMGGSREVYVKPGTTPLQKLRKAAGGKR